MPSKRVGPSLPPRDQVNVADGVFSDTNELVGLSNDELDRRVLYLLNNEVRLRVWAFLGMAAQPFPVAKLLLDDWATFVRAFFLGTTIGTRSYFLLRALRIRPTYDQINFIGLDTIVGSYAIPYIQACLYTSPNVRAQTSEWERKPLFDSLAFRNGETFDTNGRPYKSYDEASPLLNDLGDDFDNVPSRFYATAIGAFANPVRVRKHIPDFAYDDKSFSQAIEGVLCSLDDNRDPAWLSCRPLPRLPDIASVCNVNVKLGGDPAKTGGKKDVDSLQATKDALRGVKELGQIQFVAEVACDIGVEADLYVSSKPYLRLRPSPLGNWTFADSSKSLKLPPLDLPITVEYCQELRSFIADKDILALRIKWDVRVEALLVLARWPDGQLRRVPWQQDRWTVKGEKEVRKLVRVCRKHSEWASAPVGGEEEV